MLATPDCTPQAGPTRLSSPPMLSGPLQGRKSLFRVSIQQPSESPDKRLYHSRRAHRKSRGGCVKCKERRVKCDESKPHCLRCRKASHACSYDAAQSFSREKGIISYLIDRVPSLTSPDAAMNSMSLLAVSTRINELLQLKPKDGHLSDSVLALHHFNEFTTPTVSSKRAHNLMKTKMIQIALETPFLMHTVIAAATSHLCHVVPDNTSYTTVEAYHWQQAISQYSQEITTVNASNMDALISACLLMTTNSFRLEEYNPRGSFVFSTDPDALNWLMIQSGLRHLLGLTQPWLGQSIWFETFMASRGDIAVFEDHRPGRVDLDPALADLCGITDSTTEESNPYHWPLRMLTPLLGAERSVRSFSQYTNFMGRLLPEFYEQLRAKDPPALIVLAWWLALVHSTGIWWMENRVRSECAAICMFLEGGEDVRVLRLLEFPAARCGYLLRHVQEEIQRGLE